MIYRIVTYDRPTELMKGSVPIPWNVLSEVKRIAGFQPQDDGLGEYELNEEQTRQIARIMGFYPNTARFYYYVEPYDVPEDDGLQPDFGQTEMANVPPDDIRPDPDPTAALARGIRELAAAASLTQIFPGGPLLRLSERSHVSLAETAGDRG